MILYFATGKYTNTIRALLEHWTPDLQACLTRMSYEEMWSLERIPKATYIFSDHERMSPDLLRLTSEIADQLERHGPVLNHPRKVMTRFALLKELADRGWNDFRAYRLRELPTTVRFPVFVRAENDHKGPRSGLLESFAEVERAAADLVVQGFESDRLIVVEYMAKASPDGLFRRYGAHRVGEAILPQILTYDTDWRVKGAGYCNRELFREEEAYVRDNPHEQQVRRAFEAANIQYGRMDYSIVDGRVQVYEINTNPLIMWRKPDISLKRRRRLSRPFSRRFADTLKGLSPQETGWVELDREAAVRAAMGGESVAISGRA